ncbi:phage tail tip lysozyme [Chitinophaga sp. XS-30]|uniref:phage tail tip lysozyme n=1 Tax=Chitinophaga sp. XS-30 TaxID=2604421 RepID=UPI0011DE414A|nr:phage tail tip lysozyme [Chitinophaga sp. XS-30]QEH42980.1 hypothetical protein FW415_19745 [Chitinophaga sp. XS-30]
MSTPEVTRSGSRTASSPAVHSNVQGPFFQPVNAANSFFGSPPVVQRQVATPPASAPTAGGTLSAPLTDSEWRSVETWSSCGFVGIDPLTDDPDRNALLMAAALFCERMLFSPEFDESQEDPLLCIHPEVTMADSRVQTLATHVASRGPILSWEQRTIANPVLYAMERLIDRYNFPVNGAAGLVGNLRSESGVIPSRVEGSAGDTPMRAEGFDGAVHDFTPEDIMNRSSATGTGPLLPGVGIAQWTSGSRRSGLFEHQYCGMTQGVDILFNMDAQIDYLVTELQTRYRAVYSTITNPATSVNDASDIVLRRFEVPGVVLNAGALRPITDPAIAGVLTRRRNLSQSAFNTYREAHP